ncbi:MAG: hypothetical protein WC495_02895 [Patescibacteria group bacterium]|jgi:hypothetical protein
MENRNGLQILSTITLLILAGVSFWSFMWKLDTLVFISTFCATFSFAFALLGIVRIPQKRFWIFLGIVLILLGIRATAVYNPRWGSMLAVNRDDPTDVRVVTKGFSWLSAKTFKIERVPDDIRITYLREGFHPMRLYGTIDVTKIGEVYVRYGGFEAYQDSIAVQAKKVIDGIADANPIRQNEPESWYFFVYLVQKEIRNQSFPFIYGGMRAEPIGLF